MADRINQNGDDFEAIGRGIGKEISGPRLSYDRQYTKFLESSRFFNKRFESIRPEAAPGYYVLMNESEQIDHDLSIEIFNAANFKKMPPSGMPPNLDTLSKNPGFEEMATPETKRLCEIPGVTKALYTFVEVFDSDRPLGEREEEDNRGNLVIKEYSLRTAKNRSEVNVCRNAIALEIKNNVINGYIRRGQRLDDSEIKRKCIEAEQIAFALAYVGGIFDSLDSVWSDEGRERPFECFNDCVKLPMKLAMNPMDWIIITFNKTEDDVSPYPGKLGVWGFDQAMASNGGKKLKIKMVRFIDNEDDPALKDRFWKVFGGGDSITVPECCPRKLVKSVFEETKVKRGERDVPIIDFIRAGEDIPWDEVKDSMWSDYSTLISKAAVISDHLQGKVPIQWGDTNKYTGWARDIEGALSKFGLRKSDSVKRWILYATLGVDPKKRAPYIASRTDKLASPTSLGETGANFLSKDKMFFPWDN